MMKRKRQKVPKERNVFVAAALFRKAGAHTKTNKAKRKREKQDFTENIRTGSSEAEQGAFNPKVEISKFSRFTITLMIHTSQIWVTPQWAVSN
jgi:hypothetical protein